MSAAHTSESETPDTALVKARSWRSYSIIPVAGLKTNTNARVSPIRQQGWLARFSQDLDFQAVLLPMLSMYNAAPCARRSFVARIDQISVKANVRVFTVLESRSSSEVPELVLTPANGIRQSERSRLARVIFCFSKGAGERVGDGK